MRKKYRTNLAPLGLLLFAAVLRLFFEPGWRSQRTETAAPPEPVQAAEPVSYYEEIELAPPADTAEPTLEPESPTLIRLSLDNADPEKVQIRNQTGYSVSLDELAQIPLSFDTQAEGPTVLLIHTHTTEAYTPEPGWEYEANDVMRTMDSSYNMVRIGDEVERVLNDAGLWVIHDESINDYPSYNGSYGTALTRIQAWLERYPSIQMVLDLHRDAAEDARGRYVSTSCTVGGVDAAQLMLVCGTDYGGLEHPDWRSNLAFAAQLQAALEKANPGICRPLDLRCERFNQHATPLSLLIEVGSVGDTLSRALPSAEALGNALVELLCQP